MTAEQTTPSGLAATVTMPVPFQEAADVNLRERLGEFRALLVISLLMTESVGEDQILELAASSAPGLGTWRIEGYGFTDGRWRPGSDYGAPASAGLAGQLAALGSGAGWIELPGHPWAWAFPLRSVSGLLGHLVASCEREPSAEERFLIHVVAQQTGVAVSNARLHAKERATAAELAVTNAALAETVASLRRSMDIHDRLTRVEVSGEGQPGIAKALHELLGIRPGHHGHELPDERVVHAPRRIEALDPVAEQHDVGVFGVFGGTVRPRRVREGLIEHVAPGQWSEPGDDADQAPLTHLQRTVPC